MNAASDPSPAFARILLTGGAGFVGAHLRRRLALAHPRAERLLTVRASSDDVGIDWPVMEVDIADSAAVDALVGRFRPDLLIHLAAQSSVASSLKGAEETWRVNFDGTFNLARACARLDAPATFLFVSSAEVYGESFRDGDVTEETPLRPANAYARSKAAAEQMLLDVLPPASPLIVARPFNHTGAGQAPTFVMPSFAAQIAAIEAGRRPARIQVGNLDAERDFLDVDDVCSAYLGLLAAASRLPKRFVVNVSSGSSYRIGDMLDMLAKHALAPFDIDIDSSRLRPNDIKRAAGSNARLVEATSWRKTIPLDKTLAAVLAFARAQPTRTAARVGV